MNPPFKTYQNTDDTSDPKELVVDPKELVVSVPEVASKVTIGSSSTTEVLSTVVYNSSSRNLNCHLRLHSAVFTIYLIRINLVSSLYFQFQLAES